MPTAVQTGKSPSIARWALAGLVAYSAALLLAEWIGGQPLARDLCSDILGSTRFHAVNTTVSVFLLAAAGVLLVFAQATRSMDPGERRYFAIQATLLLGLACDDRFLVHETLGELTGVPDALILGGVGVAQLLVLVRMARLGERGTRARWQLAGAAVAFGLMCAIDATQESLAWPGRLTAEDLAKTWGAACMFGYAWSIARAPLGGGASAP